MRGQFFPKQGVDSTGLYSRTEKKGFRNRTHMNLPCRHKRQKRKGKDHLKKKVTYCNHLSEKQSNQRNILILMIGFENDKIHNMVIPFIPISATKFISFHRTVFSSTYDSSINGPRASTHHRGLGRQSHMQTHLVTRAVGWLC